MKSSRSLQLTLMMGAAATLGSCSEPPQSFTSVAECTQYGKPLGLCQSAYDEALEGHLKTAPTFTSDVECRAKVDVDQCLSLQVKNNDGTIRQVITPMMVGFMIGTSLPGRRAEETTSAGGYSYNGGSYHGTALYRSRRYADAYWTGTQLPNSNFSARPPNVRSHTFARSGFGGRGFGGG